MSYATKSKIKKFTKSAAQIGAVIGAAALFSVAAASVTGVLGGSYAFIKIASFAGAIGGQYLAHRTLYNRAYRAGHTNDDPHEPLARQGMHPALAWPLAALTSLGTGALVGNALAYPIEYMQQGEFQYGFERLRENLNPGILLLGTVTSLVSVLPSASEAWNGYRDGVRDRLYPPRQKKPTDLKL